MRLKVLPRWGAVTSLDSQTQGDALGWQMLPRWGVFLVSLIPAVAPLPMGEGLGVGPLLVPAVAPLPTGEGQGVGLNSWETPSFVP